MEQTNYIYLVKEREFIKTKENIYKIGRSKQENTKRFLQYPKGSELMLQETCKDCIKIERAIINEFKNHFIHRKDIGIEYFEGEYLKMRKIIWEYLLEDSNEVNKDNNETIKKYEINKKIIFEDLLAHLIENELVKNKIDNYVNNYVKNFEKDLEIFINERENFEKRKKEFDNNVEKFLKENKEIMKSIEESKKENEDIIKHMEESKKETLESKKEIAEIIKKINDVLKIRELEREIKHIKNYKN
jgi:hypothetical protein